jgi:hypothetical protein
LIPSIAACVDLANAGAINFVATAVAMAVSVESMSSIRALSLAW